MVPPDGDRAKRLPTLSWESVVDDGPATSAAVPTTVPPPPPTAPLVLPSVPTTSTGSAPLTFEPMTLTPAPTTPAPTTPAPTAEPSISASFAPVAFEPMTLGELPLDSVPLDSLVSDGTAQVHTAAPSSVVPAIGDVEIGPTDVSPAPAPPIEALPEIREATPVDISDSSEIEVLVGHDAAAAGPQLPVSVQPDQRVASSVAALAYTESAVPTAMPTAAQHRKRRRARSGVKLFMTLVVLGGLVAAGVVFGRPYLFPDDWEAAAAPYVDVVETGLGLEFVEPVAVVAEPAPEFDMRLASQLLGESIDRQPQWRALGLTTAPVTVESVAQQVTGSQSTMYSIEDGQVYHDEGVMGSALDAQLTVAMAVASLDQNFAWSADQATRTLDDAASTSAEVLRQARAVQQQSEYDEPIAPVTTAQSVQLPAVLAYRALAPEHFAEFDNPVADGADNPLHRLGTQGPGPLPQDRPIAAGGPTMIADDVVTASPEAMDRSFWFLVFAGFLDSRSAYMASEAIVENSLTVAERGTNQCVYATFSGGDVEQTGTLRTALQTWSDNAPVEFASSFSILDDGTMQLISCDPGAAFQAPVRAGTAEDLIAWRMLELATIELVGTADLTGGEPGLVWQIVQASDVAIEVGSLPADTAPADVAAAVREGINVVFTPTD